MVSSKNSIEELSLVAKVGSRPLYAGWSVSGLPVLTTSSTDLSEKAREDLKTFNKSDSLIPKLPLRNNQLSVVILSVAGPVQDMKDQSARKLTQDTIKVSVTDTRGDSSEITLGELEVLRMIADGLIVFQRLGTVLDTADRQEAVEIYSFFLPGSDGFGEDITERPDQLLLVKPTNDNVGNLIDIVIFISDVIKKLIANDRRQPAGYKKGYLVAEDEAEKQIAKQLAKEGGLFSFLYVPVTKEENKSTLKDLLTDFLMVPTDGSKPVNPLMVPVEKKAQFSDPSKDNLLLLRTIAAKMYLHAKSRINPD